MASCRLEVGTILKGRQHNYEITKNLPSGWSTATLFKASVLDGKTGHTPQFAVIKTAPLKSQPSLHTEIAMYSQPSIQSCQHIRPLLDIITEHNYNTSNPPPYLALAWMDKDLSHINVKQYGKNPAVLKSILDQILQGLLGLEAAGIVHSDIKWDNFLYNSPRTGEYDIKLSDLGSSTANGFAGEPTGNLATRAPEIFEGKGYYHHSDVWAVGMMLLEYFKEYNLGDMLPESNHIFEEVMMANLMLLYPEWNPHLAKRQEWMNISPQGLIEGAERYKSILGGVPPLEQLLSELDINKEFKDILKRLLDLDPRRRSSALAILESPEYEALNRAVYG